MFDPSERSALESAMLQDLHRGPLEDPPWSSFMRRLRIATRSDYVNLTFRRRDAPLNDLTTFAEGRLSDGLVARYFTEDYRGDPIPYHSLTPGRVYALEDAIDSAQEAKGHFTRDFLHPAGMRHGRIMRIAEPNGYTAWLTISRHDDKAFGVAEASLVEGLAAHLSLAVQTFAALEQNRRLRDLYEGALRRLNVAVLTLDADGRILSRNEAAAALLQARAILQPNADGVLVLKSAAARRRLSVLLHSYAADPEAAPRAIPLSEAPRREMLVSPVRNRPASGLHTPVLTAYFQADIVAADHVEGLTRLYDLTRSEARLALSIANGHGVAAAAAASGITTESARTYLKRIYSKTGTSRQAELVRSILTSVLVLPEQL